jgi:hypothetical protein
MLFIDRFAKVTDDTFAQGTGPINIVRKRSHEDCRNCSPGRDEVAMEFDPSHRRHMDIGDQAGRFSETRGCEEIRWRDLFRRVFDAANSVGDLPYATYACH